jgi:hypothetical protein
MTLSDATITAGPPILLKNGANVTLILAAATTNTLTVPYASDGPAALQVPVDNKITITGSGALIATVASHYGYAAGIGGYNAGPDCGMITIEGSANVTAKGGGGRPSVHDGSAGIGGGPGGAGGIITIRENATVTAISPAAGNGWSGAAIGGGGGGGYSGTGNVGGTITIGGNAVVMATAGGYAAGIGGGHSGAGGIINIGGSAQVMATTSAGGAGIGGGWAASGGTITIDGSAQVKATAGNYGAGIGSGNSSNSTPANTVIKISGSAKVYAQGGMDGAGIGGGDGNADRTSGAKITIGTGSDYPIVIAKGGATTNSSTVANADSACGIGAGGTSYASVVEIEINSGFVAAQSNRPNGRGIGINPAAASTSYVRISGGSVYAENTLTPANLVNPAPKNSSSMLVYPLYVAASHANKGVLISTTTYKTISPEAAAMLAGTNPFFGSAPVGLFNTALSATFWLLPTSYSGITVGGASGYTATVSAPIGAYTGTGNNRLLPW